MKSSLLWKAEDRGAKEGAHKKSGAEWTGVFKLSDLYPGEEGGESDEVGETAWSKNPLQSRISELIRVNEEQKEELLAKEEEIFLRRRKIETRRDRIETLQVSLAVCKNNM